MPSIIFSDNGGDVSNSLTKRMYIIKFITVFNYYALELYKTFGTIGVQGRPYYPQARGLIERKVRTIKAAV